MVSLNTINPGEKCKIISISAYPALKRRLKDLGFVKNATVTCLYKSFSGDPTAYRIKGSVIALRNADAKKIIVNTPEGKDYEE
ncbi:MAG: ferrous iron transport protein A [Clostridia bacterium]|nr:ferrous iron transport protein A [Clostridia bacterium]